MGRYHDTSHSFSLKNKGVTFSFFNSSNSPIYSIEYYFLSELMYADYSFTRSAKLREEEGGLYKLDVIYAYKRILH